MAKSYGEVFVMMRFDFTAKDDKRISIVEWQPQGEVKGIVQIFHGMAEHAMRYDAHAKLFTDNGFLVVCDDHRAHGHTDIDTLGYSSGDIFNLTLSDEKEIFDFYTSKYPNAKRVLFGHSYGSFLLQRFIQVYPNTCKNIILGGSAKMSGIAPFFGNIVASLGNEKKPANFIKKITFDTYNKKCGGSFISSILEEAKRYDADELCGFICSNAFYKYFFRGLLKAYKKEELNKIDKDINMLIISGKNDPVGDFSKSVILLDKMYRELKIDKIKLCLFENSRHEYFNDVCKKTAYEEVLSFINSIE